jgi:tRNA(fMet)-specific endonuclease VapC
MTVLPYDEQIISSYANLTVEAVRLGHPLGQAIHSNDAWIAATAMTHDVPLVSLNHRHFADLPGLVLLPETTVELKD